MVYQNRIKVVWNLFVLIQSVLIDNVIVYYLQESYFPNIIFAGQKRG